MLTNFGLGRRESDWLGMNRIESNPALQSADCTGTAGAAHERKGQCLRAMMMMIACTQQRQKQLDLALALFLFVSRRSSSFLGLV